MNVFKPNSVVKGMTTLNRDMFKKTVQLPALVIQPKKCALFVKEFKQKTIHRPGIKTVHDQDDNKVLLLQPITLSDDEKKWIKDNDGVITEHTLNIGYEHYTIHEVLHAILPMEEVPSAFEQVGHIAHLNLKEEHLPYKHVIGQVLVDKQPGIETVVNKMANIDETFRFFQMDVLAGNADMITTVKENGCSFNFDFSKVYWNSRLHTEHKRIIDLLKPNDVVLDVFAGVGPFAIPAARKGCIVHANDLNPDAYTSLIRNAVKNKAENLKAYCLDGRDFIVETSKNLLSKYLSDEHSQNSGTVISHIIMNLPAIAVKFLDVFTGLFTSVPPSIQSKIKPPRVHCYCFSKAENFVSDAVHQVETYLGTKLDLCNYDVLNVRDVAPKKVMMRVSFDLPHSLLFSKMVEMSGSEEASKSNYGIKRTLSVHEDSRIETISQDEEIGQDCDNSPPAKKEKH